MSRRVVVGPGMVVTVPDELEELIAEYLLKAYKESDMSKKTEKGPGLWTDEERAAIPERRAAHRRRMNITDQAVRAAGEGSHVSDRLELVRRYVAGVAHEFELLMTGHPDRWGELDTKLDAPSDALGKAATEYAAGGALGDFLLALDAYQAELRRIVEGFGPRSLND